MARRLASAHIEGERRLREAAVTGIERIWRALPGYDKPNLDQWLSQVIPLALAAQRQSVALTEAYIARSLERQPVGLNAVELTGPAVRAGVSSEEQWTRPFVTMWGALGESKPWQDAFDAGWNRASQMAAMDPQLSMRAAANAAQEPYGIIGYERVADGDACTFCQEVDTAFVRSADAMALHDRCGCGLEPVTYESRGQRTGLKGQHGRRNVAIHEHGELGPVLAAPADSFTTEAQALGQ